MEQQLDVLARAVASGEVSRRKALRQLGGAMAGAVLAYLGIGCETTDGPSLDVAPDCKWSARASNCSWQSLSCAARLPLSSVSRCSRANNQSTSSLASPLASDTRLGLGVPATGPPGRHSGRVYQKTPSTPDGARGLIGK